MDNDLIINTHPRPLYVGRMDPNPEWGLKEHRHDYCEVVYIAEGGGTLRVAGTIPVCGGRHAPL